MAGLLDIFGTGNAETLGLLGLSPEDIQKKQKDAQADALFALAGSLFKGGKVAPSILQGLQQGSQAYQNTMQAGLQQQLQNAQLQEMLKKRQQEQQTLAEQKRVQNIVGQGVIPEQATFQGQPSQFPARDDQGNLMPDMAIKPAGFDLARIAPQLMASTEGRKSLAELFASQKAMRPETFSLAEGAAQFERDPFTGETKQIATGAPKREPVPSAIAEYKFAQDQGYKGSFQDFELAKRVAGSPKVSVDLKDPTAVAKAQSDVIKDWRGVVKDVGAMEVADRYKAAQAAVQEANAGNKTADGALIYAIGKIYDPSGAVQEGDKKTILGNRSIPQSIQAYAQRALNGQELLPQERAGLLAVAGKLVESKARNLEAQKAPYISISQQLGGNGSLLLNPLADALTSPVQLMPTAADIAAEIARRRNR
jgi:hypothetical protein